MRFKTIILSLPISLLMLSCTHKGSSVTLPNAEDSIIGTYTGAIHITDTNSFSELFSPTTYSYIDTTYTFTIVVSKVSPDSFTTSIFVNYSLIPNPTYSLAYNSANFYSSTYGYIGLAPNYYHNDMTFVPSKDSMYFTHIETGSSHGSGWVDWKSFAGKKQ